MQNTVVPPEKVVELRDWAWETVNTDKYKISRIEREIRSRRALDSESTDCPPWIFILSIDFQNNQRLPLNQLLN